MLTGPIPKLVDYRKLANQEGRLEGSIPVSQLTRLGELLAADSGDIQLDLAFGITHSERFAVSGKISGIIQLICQNCMEQFGREMHGSLDMIVVDSEERLAELDDEDDGFICPDKLLDIAELVEDELLLLVPMIPRHLDGECPDNEYESTDPVKEEEVQTETYRPFANIADVLKESKDTES